jgi:hypothetical protein
MTPERWQQVQRLYQSALGQEPSKRADFLKKACTGDEELRREVESLLAHGGETEKSALEVAVGQIAADRGQSLVGRQIGSYKVLSTRTLHTPTDFSEKPMGKRAWLKKPSQKCKRL